MKIESLQANADNTVGFVRVKEFKGCTTRISVKKMMELMNLLKVLYGQGFEYVKLGIENDNPLLVFFGENTETAYAIAPMRKEDIE